MRSTIPTLTLTLTLTLTACGSRRGVVAPPPDAGVIAVSTADAAVAAVPHEPRPRLPAELVAISKLEGARKLVPELIAFAKDPNPKLRYRAAIALGRVGGPEAIALLKEMLADQERGVRVAAMQGLGFTGNADVEGDLLALVGKVEHPDWQPSLLGALARVGGARAAGVAAESLHEKRPSPERAAAAMALGVLTQRKVKLPADVRAKLLAAAGDKLMTVRLGVVYALSREPETAWDAKSTGALAKLATDQDAEVKALALRALASRPNAPSEPAELALGDEDWRVRVEGVRILTSEKGSAERRAKAVAYLDAEWTAIATDAAALIGPRVHVVLEGLDRLQTAAKEKPVLALFTKLAAKQPAGTDAGALRVADRVHCTALAGVARGAAFDEKNLARLMTCGEATGIGWPMHLRRALVADLVREGLAGPLESAWGFVDKLWGDPDVRVRAAAAAAAVVLDDPRASKIVREALASTDQVMLETVADAVAVYAEKNAGKARPEYVTLLVERAKDEKLDVELRLTLFGALRAARSAEAVPIFEAALADPNGVMRASAAESLLAVTGRAYAPVPPRAATPLPPVEIDDLPAMVRFTVTTTKGVFTMELNAYFAPWNVATMTALAKKGFYDGTLWHRVVPNFVVQGGDPTGTGMGGPGFMVPAEPSTLRYLRGTVGIADAGLDTGGSQFFVTHGPTPHLEGRYTIVGMITGGKQVIDSLVVGDRILEVEVDDR